MSDFSARASAWLEGAELAVFEDEKDLSRPDTISGLESNLLDVTGSLAGQDRSLTSTERPAGDETPVHLAASHRLHGNGYALSLLRGMFPFTAATEDC